MAKSINKKPAAKKQAAKPFDLDAAMVKIKAICAGVDKAVVTEMETFRNNLYSQNVKLQDLLYDVNKHFTRGRPKDGASTFTDFVKELPFSRATAYLLIKMATDRREGTPPKPKLSKDKTITDKETAGTKGKSPLDKKFQAYKLIDAAIRNFQPENDYERIDAWYAELLGWVEDSRGTRRGVTLTLTYRATPCPYNEEGELIPAKKGPAKAQSAVGDSLQHMAEGASA